jgi:hypothetical protein
MPRGGARNRGPMVRAQNSEAARIRRAGALVLPAEGYRGTAPAFPLPGASERELEVWTQSWRSPQAVAWVDEPWRWRTLGLWVRWSVRMEDPDAPAALGQVVVRLADQCGLTPAGLVENGWRLADSDEVPNGLGVQDRRGLASVAPGSSLERARLRARLREGGGAELPDDPRDALRDV